MSEYPGLPKTIARYVIFTLGATPFAWTMVFIFSLPVFLVSHLTGTVSYYAFAVVVSGFALGQYSIRRSVFPHGGASEDQNLEGPRDATKVLIVALWVNMLLAISIVLASAALSRTGSVEIALLVVGVYPLVDGGLSEIRWWLSPSMMLPGAILTVGGQREILSKYKIPVAVDDYPIFDRLSRKVP